MKYLGQQTDDKDVATKDLIPSVGNGTITITQGGATKGSFTTNQSGNATIALDAGGSGGGNVTYTEVSTPSSTPAPFADYYNKSAVDSLLLDNISGDINKADKIVSKAFFGPTAGYIKYASGLIIQWNGLIPAGHGASLNYATFLLSYVSAPIVLIEQISTGSTGTQYFNSQKVVERSASGFTWQNGQSELPTFMYLAIGV